MKVRLPVGVVLLMSHAILASGGALAASTVLVPGGCAGVGFHQFDFWIGEWDVFDFGGSIKVATATVAPIQNGCGLREQYRGVTGGGGESLTMYDPVADTWHQAWVSNRGQIVSIEGRLHEGAISLMGPEYGTGPGHVVRGKWVAGEDSTVHETAERSEDSGHTWHPWFDIVFRKAEVPH